MSAHLTAEEVLAAIADLTPDRLTAYIEIGIIIPVQGEAGPLFAPVDCARLQLICELAQSHDLADDALEMVMSLVDQLHSARAELQALGAAVDTQPDRVRKSVLAAWRAARGG
jgi:chaperone modulatory protein CbpM